MPVVREVLDRFRRAFKRVVHRLFLSSIEFAQDVVDQFFGVTEKLRSQFSSA